MAFRLNFAGDTKEGCEDAGRKVEPGFYRAVVNDVFVDQDTADTVFVLVIADGPFKGLKVWERIPDPSMISSDKQSFQDFVIKRIKSLGARLHVIPDEVFGVDQDVDVEFEKLIGDTIIVEVEDNSYTKADGTVKHTTRLSAFGMWPLDYPPEKFPKALRVALKIMLPGETEPPTAATGKKGGGNSKAQTQAAAAAIGAKHDLSDL